jgi:MFS family permease
MSITLKDKLKKQRMKLWHNKNFLLLLSGQGVSAIGTQISQLAFPLLVLALTHSPVQTGLMTALRGLPYVLFCLPAGALADRWPRKKVMLVCDCGRVLAMGSIPLAMIIGTLTLWQIYLVALIEGTLFTFFHMAESAILPHIVSKEQLTEAAGQNEVIGSLSILLGPSLGGILYSFSNAIPFLGDAVSYACSVISLCFIQVPAEQTNDAAPTRRHLLREIQEGLDWLWHNPILRFCAVLAGGLITSSIGFILIVIVLGEQQHASPFVIGLIFGSGGVGSVVGAMLASPLQKRFGFARVMIASTWIWALSWLLYAFAPTPLLLGLANGLSYTIVPIFMVTQYSYRLALIPDHLQGRVNSVFRLIAFGGQPIGMAITGALIQVIGALPTVFVLFVPQLLLAIAVTMNKAMRDAPSMKML